MKFFHLPSTGGRALKGELLRKNSLIQWTDGHHLLEDVENSVTLIRNPVPRVLSLWKNCRGKPFPSYDIPPVDSLEEFLSLDNNETRNGQVYRLSGGTGELEHALEAIQRMVLVGVTPRHNQFVERLNELTGEDLQSRVSGATRKEKYSTEIMSWIAQNNQKDAALYSVALEMNR